MTRNLVVTGLPRGGTTLLAALIDSSPNAVCVSEPAWPVATSKRIPTSQEFVGALARGYEHVRAQIACGEPIDDVRDEQGRAVTNYLGRSDDGSRIVLTEAGSHIRAAPRGDYTLAIKNNGLFLSVLPDLALFPAFETLALIRHPRDVFASWLEVPFPVSRARLPVGEKFWPDLRALGTLEAPLPRRMALLYDLLLRRIVTSGVDHLSRYEDLIEHPETLFCSLHLERGDLSLALKQIRTPSPAADDTLAELRAISGISQEYYSF